MGVDMRRLPPKQPWNFVGNVSLPNGGIQQKETHFNMIYMMDIPAVQDFGRTFFQFQIHKKQPQRLQQKLRLWLEITRIQTAQPWIAMDQKQTVQWFSIELTPGASELTSVADI
jgi:hypothetical protein